MIGKTNAISGVSEPVPKIRTVSGSVISISNALALPAVSLAVDIDPVQDLHGYDKPWAGGAGKNLYNKANGAEHYYVNSSDKYVNSANTYSVVLPCKPSTTYTVSKTAGTRFTVSYAHELPVSGLLCYGKITDNTATSITITTDADAQYLIAYVWYKTQDEANISLDDMLASVQIELGSTATAYEPYENICQITGWSNVNVYREAQYDAGATPYATISLNDTVYGGTLDVVSGVLTVDRVKRVLNDASKWAAYTGTVDFYYNVEFGDRKTFSDSYTGLSCSYIQINSQASNTNTGRWRGAVSQYFGIRSNALTLEQIQADAIAGKIEICYELATPQTVQLLPTTVQMLAGNNALWADSGDSELQYWARR